MDLLWYHFVMVFVLILALFAIIWYFRMKESEDIANNKNKKADPLIKSLLATVTITFVVLLGVFFEWWVFGTMQFIIIFSVFMLVFIYYVIVARRKNPLSFAKQRKIIMNFLADEYGVDEPDGYVSSFTFEAASYSYNPGSETTLDNHTVGYFINMLDAVDAAASFYIEINPYPPGVITSWVVNPNASKKRELSNRITKPPKREGDAEMSGDAENEN